MVLPPQVVGNIGQDIGEASGNETLVKNSVNMSSNMFGTNPSAYNDYLSRLHGSGRESSLDSMSEREFLKYMQENEIDASVASIGKIYREYLKLGLNPRLMLDKGGFDPIRASSGYSYSQSQSESKSTSSSSSMSFSALAAALLLFIGKAIL